MPSISEGLNLTPVESTVCGCPAVICDGAIDELFYNSETCFVVEKDSKLMMSNRVQEVMINFEKYSDHFRKNITAILTEYTWEMVVEKMIKLM